MKKLFSETGYISSELVNIYRLQTEPEEVIAGYAEQEIHEGVVFDFYDHSAALPIWQKECEGYDLSVEEIKRKLQPFRMSAFDALRVYKKHGRPIGHIYSIFKLTT